MNIAALLMLVLIFAALPGAGAHDSPEHMIARFTAIMAENGRTPLLLLQRAVEYRLLGKTDRAIADLRAALKLDPKCLPAQTELSRVYLEQGRTDAALNMVNAALALIARDDAKGQHYMLRAEIQAARGRSAEALADCDRAFRSDAVELDWYLIRGMLQRRLGLHADAVVGLKEGFEKTGSAVLEAQWIEALIDSGKAREAIRLVETHLAESRLQSSWLLRRARARLALNQTAEGESDLRAALKELDERLRSNSPDLTLLADRGLCYALLGDLESARRDYTSARLFGADGWILERLEKALTAKPAAPPTPPAKGSTPRK